MPNYRHYCPDWDFLEIDADDPEIDGCNCIIDSDGRGPKFYGGDRVFVGPANEEAMVIMQYLHYDGPDSFWGNVQVEYDDGEKRVCHSWQLEKVESDEKTGNHSKD